MGDLPLLVDDSIPKDEYISWAVRGIRLNRLGGPSGMRVEHLRQWLIAAMWDKFPDVTKWLKVIAIVQVAFHDETLAD